MKNFWILIVLSGLFTVGITIVKYETGFDAAPQMMLYFLMIIAMKP